MEKEIKTVSNNRYNVHIFHSSASAYRGNVRLRINSFAIFRINNYLVSVKSIFYKFAFIVFRTPVGTAKPQDEQIPFDRI